MPRPTRAYGRPGTAVIPVDWAESHAPVAEQFMTTSRVSLRRPGYSGTRFDDALGHSVPSPYAPFAVDVPANIEAMLNTTRSAGSGPSDVVDDQVVVLGYLVTIPTSIPVGQLDEGVVVEVTSCPDPLLAGQSMHVVDIVRGVRLFERALVCQLNS